MYIEVMNECQANFLNGYVTFPPRLDDYYGEVNPNSVTAENFGFLKEAQRYHMEHGLIVAVPSVKVSRAVMISAGRMANIARDLVGVLVWPDRDDVSVKLKTWRKISLETIYVGCNAILLEKLTVNVAGLDKTQMKLISGVTNQVSLFFNEFCNNRATLCARGKSLQNQNVNLDVIHEPIRRLVGTYIKKEYPEEEELHLHFKVLTRDFFQSLMIDFLTPQVITEILLNLEFPYGDEGGGEDVAKGEQNALCVKYPAECDELGEALLTCVDILLSAAKDRLIDNSRGLAKAKQVFCKLGVNIGTSLLKGFRRKIGGFVFATVNAALRSEGSKIFPIIELWLKRTEEASKIKKQADLLPKSKKESKIQGELELRSRLDHSLRKDLSKLIKHVISENDDESKGIKDQAEKIIGEITPLIVELIWDREAKAIANLLFYFIPQAPCLQLPDIPPKTISKTEKKPAEAQRLESFVLRFVEDYLGTISKEQTAVKNQANWNGVLLNLIKIGIRRAFGEKAEMPNPEIPNPEMIRENTLRLRYIFGAVNQFLCDSIENKHSFTMKSEEINKPLISLVSDLVRIKYAGMDTLQREVVSASLGLVNTFIDTLLNPVVIGNLILKIQFDNISISQPAVAQEELQGYDDLGQEVVKLLCTILTLGSASEKLSFLDGWGTSFASAYYRATIGSKLAQAIHAAAVSNDTAMFKFVEMVLWGANEGTDSKPIFFEGWINDKVELQAALEVWVKQLLHFVSEAVSSQGLLVKAAIEPRLLSVVSLVTQKLFTLIWHDDNKAIRILVMHYLLPIIKPHLVSAFQNAFAEKKPAESK